MLRTQLCFSGGSLDPVEVEFEGEDVTYYPKPNAFDCPILAKCDEQTETNPDCDDFLDYFLVLGLCILMVKKSFPKPVGARVLVGFDSGDSFELV